MQNDPFLIGCCGWAEAKQKYFANFPTVELQSTFYELPSVALASNWRSLSPDSFQFCMKAWQLITHTPSSPTYRKLKSKLHVDEYDLVGSFKNTEQVMLAWERTAEVGQALDARVILFQCPASFSPEPENLKNLRRFFFEIDRRQFALAWEPRGEWPLDVAADLCRDLDLLLCVDPFAIDPTDLEAPYWRLHGRGGYSYRYSDDDIEKLARLSRKCGMKTAPPQYIFFNNVWMKEDALRFKHRLTQQVSDRS